MGRGLIHPKLIFTADTFKGLGHFKVF
uniref:Uncharacterized protein n=1 Tax=Anguilla anguilla TaxID=7936 RepID=A0A0E9P632_ANGAN